MVLPIMASSNQCWAVIRNGTKKEPMVAKDFSFVLLRTSGLVVDPIFHILRVPVLGSLKNKILCKSSPNLFTQSSNLIFKKLLALHNQ
jgi:hypothetical protein